MNIEKFLKKFLPFTEADGAGSGGGGAGSGAGDGGTVGNGGAGAGTPPPATDIRQFIADESGGFKPGWAKAIGVDESTFGKFTSLKGVVESYGNLQKLIGKGGVQPPGDNATPEEWAAFHAKLGRPDTPDGYGIKRPDGVDVALWSDERGKAFAEIAHKAGLTPRQVQTLIDFELGNVQAQAKAIAQRPEETTALLRKEWGSQTEAKIVAAAAIAQHIGGDELLKDQFLASHPGFIKAMSKVAELLGERGGVPGMRDTGMAGLQELQAKRDAIMGDQKDPYWVAGHPQHSARVAFVTDLNRQIGLFKK